MDQDPISNEQVPSEPTVNEPVPNATVPNEPAPNVQVNNAPSLENSAKTSGLAIAGFIFAFVIPLVGLILSIIAMSQIKKSRQGGRGLAVAGLVISLIFTLLATFILVTMIIGATKLAGVVADETLNRSNARSVQTALDSSYAKDGSYPTCNATFSEAKTGCLKSSGVTLSESKCSNGGGKISSTPTGYTIDVYATDCSTVIDGLKNY